MRIVNEIFTILGQFCVDLRIVVCKWIVIACQEVESLHICKDVNVSGKSLQVVADEKTVESFMKNCSPTLPPSSNTMPREPEGS